MIVTVGLLLLALVLSPAGALEEGWGWPVDGSFDLEEGNSAAGFVYRLVPRSRDNALRAIAPGEVIFRSSPPRTESLRTSAIPREANFVAIRHREGFISGYFSEGSLEGFPRQGSGKEEHLAWIDVVLWDEVLQDQVNPRLLWSEPEVFGKTGLPQVEFVQQGDPVHPSALMEGEVVLRIPPGSLDASRLPWEIRLLEGREKKVQQRFVFPRDLDRFEEPSGGFELFRFDARPGRGAFVLEAVRFDRTLQRRTLRFTVREDQSAQPGP
ncbi:hypothetical protein SAMN05920897_1038 [Alkalispirochaeta americana]|uniref:Uncharacterized protein n=1 Tax=Alkalispirochaeta americana TaxID=159291 RepID=A0A1N6PJJ1_9SPIO|nr:hypothetical protein [Alkalispirochaeta americana]SIQ04501.1 hypothetical protein SAMN05920897_1038 [Alkalispirochaeta americana]